MREMELDALDLGPARSLVLLAIDLLITGEMPNLVLWLAENRLRDEKCFPGLGSRWFWIFSQITNAENSVEVPPKITDYADRRLYCLRAVLAILESTCER